MDGRFDARYPADFEVWVTDLQNQGYSACGLMRDISESGVCVITPLQLGIADIVRLDVGDSVLFGFVTYCNPVAAAPGDPAVAATWRAGIEVQRVLVGGSDLGQLLRQVLSEQMPKVKQENMSTPDMSIK